MRRSSRAGAPAERIPAGASEDLLFDPTPNQVQAKSLFWAKWRRDPRLDPASASLADVRSYVDVASLDKWWDDRPFRSWFLNQDEARQKLEHAADVWATQALQRIRGGVLSDKDFIALGKFLNDITGRTPAPGKGGDAPKQLSEAEAHKLFHDAALKLGYLPPAQVPGANTVDVEAEET